jgi:indolepyruvate ferredoxin oxidoreductase, beta subunit
MTSKGVNTSALSATSLNLTRSAVGSKARVYTVAILAMGGEGGGVLADWLIHLAEEAGFDAQTTSVPGVAQRTGATIYYVEFVRSDASGRSPVLSLMPVPGEVDLVVASELMEAGRALQRGLVTPSRSTLIASTHRVFSMTEKIAMGDGRVDSDKLLSLCQAQAQRFIGCDFSAIALAQGSVVSASLFGAMAASSTLPFTREQFEAAIRGAGVGVKSSLAAFDRGFEAAVSIQSIADTSELNHDLKASASVEPSLSTLPFKLGSKLEVLRPRIEALPFLARDTLAAAVTKCCDYQDLNHACLYLDRVEALWRKIGPNAVLFEETSRGLALWMTYEDIVRVADLKIRASRFRRVAQEVNLNDQQVLEIREYLHPRYEEIADSLPLVLGARLMRSRFLQSLLKPFVGEGKVLETSSLRGFIQLYLLAATRPWRPGSLRFMHEHLAMMQWCTEIESLSRARPLLALELARAQRLIKGYSDTQQRGRRSFQTLLAVLPMLKIDADGDVAAAAKLKRLADAALADDVGAALKATLSTMGFAGSDHRSMS